MRASGARSPEHAAVSQDSGGDDHLDSWLIALSAERKSPQTVKIYADGLHAFLRWCHAENIEPALDRPTVTRFTASLLDAGTAPATARPGSCRSAGSPPGSPRRATSPATSCSA
ncbi:MAG: hypothetical protein ACRDOK_02110 [Streptosporangiaceae bacterium]